MATFAPCVQPPHLWVRISLEKGGVGGFESYFPGNQKSAELFSRALVY